MLAATYRRGGGGAPCATRMRLADYILKTALGGKRARISYGIQQRMTAGRDGPVRFATYRLLAYSAPSGDGRLWKDSPPFLYNRAIGAGGGGGEDGQATLPILRHLDRLRRRGICLLYPLLAYARNVVRFACLLAEGRGYRACRLASSPWVLFRLIGISAGTWRACGHSLLLLAYRKRRALQHLPCRGASAALWFGYARLRLPLRASACCCHIANW